ncbi:hypothetical protein D3C80_1469660 [compost metagenome]
MVVQRAGDFSREPVTVNCQRTAGRDRMAVGCPEHQRVEAPHFLLQYTYCIAKPVRPQRIAAHQLGKLVGMVGRCFNHWSHFI